MSATADCHLLLHMAVLFQLLYTMFMFVSWHVGEFGRGCVGTELNELAGENQKRTGGGCTVT